LHMQKIKKELEDTILSQKISVKTTTKTKCLKL